MTAFLSCSSAPASLLVEAEFFAHKGGWIREGQFYETVGSQYLLAHGLGQPEFDAKTTVTLPKAGKYFIWVRTYNWNSPWDPNPANAPGVFQLLVDGKPTCERLGDVPTTWDWQKAGSIDYKGGSLNLALHDLTGFDARVDAIFFSMDENASMPTERPAKLRKDKNKYDLIVCGAGPGGIGAAVASSRLGQKTLLLESRDVVGGNSAPGGNIAMSGGLNLPPYENIGNVLSEYGPFYKNYDRVCKQLAGEENLTLLTNFRVIDVTMKGNSIASIIALDMTTGEKVEFRGKQYVDSTGDSFVGALAGAEYMEGQETRDVYGEDLAPEKPEKRSYGSTINWKHKSVDMIVNFPECPWAVKFNEKTRMKGRFPGMFESGFGKDQIAEAEQIRDYLFRVIYGNWSYLKNSEETKDEFINEALTEVGTILTKRESRRLVGDYILTQNDIEGDWKNRYDDPAVWVTYSIDQHFPLPSNSADFPGEEFLSTMKHNHNDLGISRRFLKQGEHVNMPYMMPYRCMYSKNVSNLFMAGRNASMSRIALCSARIAGNITMMGEVVAIASVICNKYKCTPRQVYTEHLDELKAAMTTGVPRKYDIVYKRNKFTY